MVNRKLLGDINRRKYAKAPSWEEIHAFIKEMGMNMYHFEKFYGIPFNTMAQVKSGQKKLGSPHWHIIYERIKPAYGAGFIEDYSTNTSKNRINHSITENIPVMSDGDAHSRLGKVK
jgi:hypothetical protein